MVVSKENLTDLKEQFEKAHKLVEEESKNDPEIAPYRSHYAACKVLLEMMGNLKNLIHSEEDGSDNQFTYKSILAYVYKDLGRIYAYTDETENALKHLTLCLEMLHGKELRPDAIIAILATLNEIGTIRTTLQNPQLAKNSLERAEYFYNQFKGTNLQAMTIADIFGTADEIEVGKGPKELERTYTLTTFYLAQVLGFCDDLEGAAICCNKTLRRQLEANEFESIDWALNAATLSQYYLRPDCLPVARHHLAAATCILRQYETKMITPDMSEEVKEATREHFRHRNADVARCWAKYGLALLTQSQERLMADDSVEDGNDGEKLAKDLEKVKLSADTLRFETLDLSAYEKEISDKYCLTFDDAVLVYHFVIKSLDKAKEYYTAETEASEYARIIFDYADLYKYLKFFEDSPSNQSKLYKKRADYFEGLLAILNPTYYMKLCRDCWFECGTTYSDMLDIKLDALHSLKKHELPTPQALHKINTLCDKAIKHFIAFQNSYKEKNSDEFIKNLSTNELQPLMYSSFRIGRLFYKMITPDKVMQLNNLENSLKYYTKFIAECETRDAEIGKIFMGEIEVCKQLVGLLPHKIQRTIEAIKETENK